MDMEQYRKLDRALLSVEQLIIDLEQLEGFEYSVKNLNIVTGKQIGRAHV